MENLAENIVTLVDKILTHQATDDQLATYLHWYSTLPDTDVFATMTTEQSRIKEAAILATIQTTIHRKRRKRMIQKVSLAAAVLTLVLGLSGYFWLYKPDSNKTATTLQSIKIHEIGPGGNHATLTLSNGKKLSLDLLSVGAIANQNGSEVSKKDSGLLTYSASSNNNPLVGTSIHYNTLATPRGGQYQVVLSDGTKVWLNAASSIKYPTSFVGSERSVSITGEAYFEVAHNSHKPFTVSVNGMHIKVLGTHFNVNGYGDDGVTRTTLLQGAIQISRGTNHKIIAPGQQAAVKANTETITISKVNAQDMIAWTKGFLLLQDNNVQDFMTQLSRWYNVDIEYKGKVPTKLLGGVIGRNNNLSDVLSALEASGIHAKLTGRKIIITSK
ncbi:hypothetical protein GCM10027566_36470 [Arachidicoccus ginsenosidivorans]|jgi:ferric-dicitrate binding protein FerR (iron transport regulator)|uniref:DUF4974 domain-containing protein n=1 Tax=Arachidicoccus ginsenosidivorans TaxID=496057 RepID=A0A5B8VLI3_9BACT|nr:FecR family protein [Arachidicoccus ginsenosidivorans]QEC71822.1 DUF4974 domain-containing protein [Arachidicoccus ginsenosidivorans]